MGAEAGSRDDREAPHPGSPVMPRWAVGALPEAPRYNWKKWAGLLGPGILVAGNAIGTGEWLVGPRVTAQYGGALMWVATISLLSQLVYNMEACRYTLYCGESVMTGKFRTLPGPLFWLGLYFLLDLGALLPYSLANAATSVAALFLGRIPDPQTVAGDRRMVELLTYFMLLLVMIPLVVGGRIYNSLKFVMFVKLVLVMGFLGVSAVFWSSGKTWASILGGLIALGNVPVAGNQVENVFGSLWRGQGMPAVDREALVWLTSFAAIAGIGGLAQSAISNYTRDQGWGMGAHVGAIPTITAGRSIALSHVGMVFLPNADSLRRWKGWYRHVLRDQTVVWFPACLIGLALPSMLSVEFVPRGTVGNQWVLAGMTASGLQARVGGNLGALFWHLILVCGFLVLLPSAAANADAFIRRWIDVAWTGTGALRHWDTRSVGKLYFAVLTVYLMVGFVFLAFVSEPRMLIVLYANLGNLALGISTWHILYVNCSLLPRELRPGWFARIGLVLAGTWFLACALLTGYIAISG